ncbi:muramidase [Naegleria gruberi]|uniref:Muramidase n=1 Tax=Naegleria gruberi TaxID=5762 RepID=D2VI17_NAEGR|nr:muramidase [Naegleria gruberi]EFC43438.1 muramidase [Naegleria gruberi]|eukprot:XP_002676182.1 muramidase [Naegleria gruberi]
MNTHDENIQIEINSDDYNIDEISVVFSGGNLSVNKCYLKVKKKCNERFVVKLRELECCDLIIMNESKGKIVLEYDCLILNRLEISNNQQEEETVVENHSDVDFCELIIGDGCQFENYANLQVLNLLKGEGLVRNLGMMFFGKDVEIELNNLESVGIVKFPQLESFVKEFKLINGESEQNFTEPLPRGYNYLNRVALLKGLIGKNTKTKKPQILSDSILEYLKENPVNSSDDLSEKVNEYLLRVGGTEYVSTWVSTIAPNIRKTPSAQGEISEKLEPWTTVNVKSIYCGAGENEFWACLGEEAFVSTDFLKIKPKVNHLLYPNMKGSDLLSIYGPNEPFLNDNLKNQSNQEIIVVNTPILDSNLQSIGEKLAGDLVTVYEFTEINGKSLVKISPDEEHYIESDYLSSEMDKNLLNRNIRAFLELIAFCEATYTFGYNRLVNGTPTTDPFQTCYSHGIVNITSNLNTHPFILVSLNATLKSTAAGKYQYLNRTWHSLPKEIHNNLFTPYGQDRGAIALLMRRESLQAIKQGNIELALNLCNKEWASFPNSPYGQPTKKMEECLKKYSDFLSRLQ